MALTEKQKQSNADYFKRSWQQVKLSMPKTEAAALEAYCARHGLSKAGFIRQLIRDSIAKDTPPEG